MQKEMKNAECIQKDSKTWVCRLNLNDKYEDWQISVIDKSEDEVKEIESALTKLAGNENKEWICCEDEEDNKKLVCRLKPNNL